ncbi:MAG: hypothetical protein ACKO85_11510 [Isosphaeraceae bacterium]
MVRCSECDRIITEPSTGRLKSGQIVFGWCAGCFEVAGAVRTELTDNVALFDGKKQLATPFGGTSWDSSIARSQKRIFALLMMASVLAIWGGSMLLTGFFRTDRPTPANPLGNGTSNFLIAGGGGLVGTAFGLAIGAWRARRRTGFQIKKVASTSRPEQFADQAFL